MLLFSPAASKEIIANKNYRLLFISMIISTFGSFMFFVAIQIKIFNEGSAYDLFLSILSYTVPSVFITPLIIKYTYKIKKREVLLFCSLLRLFFSIYLFFNHNIYEIYFSVFIFSLISSIAFIAQKTMLRALVDDHKVLVVKNSWLSSTEIFAEISGGIAGSLVILFINFEGVVAFLCSCLLLSTFLIFQIYEIKSDAFETPLIEAYKNVLKIITHDILLLIQVIFFCVFQAFSSILYGFLIVFVNSNFQNVVYAYSLFLLAAGLGSVTGAKIVAVLSQVNSRNNLKSMYEFSFYFGSVVYILFSFVKIIFFSISIYFIYSMIVSVLKNAHQGFIYSKFPLDLQEPAWGILNIFWHLTILFSSLFGGILIDKYGIDWVLQKGTYLALVSIFLFSLINFFNQKNVTNRSF